MPIRFKCTVCRVELSGDGASRHFLDRPTHKLVKLPSLPKPTKKETVVKIVTRPGHSKAALRKR